MVEFGLPLSTTSTPTSLSILRRSVPMQPPSLSKSGANASEPGLGRPTYPDILTHSVVALVNENVEQVLTWLSVHRNSLSLSHMALLFLRLVLRKPFVSEEKLNLYFGGEAMGMGEAGDPPSCHGNYMYPP